MMALVITISLFVASCASIGPQITSEEERRAQAILMTESQAWQKKQEQKILEVAARLIGAAEKVEPLKFHFAAQPMDGWVRVEADAVNAWTDGESVWISRGMMRFLRSDDELAIVLAHEMAHAYRGHIPFVRTKQLLEAALAVAVEVLAPGSGRAAVVLVDAATKKFDRDQEREADLYGLIWAHKAGFDVSGAKELWRRMAVEMPESMETGFLSSHPSSAERFVSIGKVADALREGLDPLRVFNRTGTRDQKVERKISAEVSEPRASKPEPYRNPSGGALAQAE